MMFIRGLSSSFRPILGRSVPLLTWARTRSASKEEKIQKETHFGYKKVTEEEKGQKGREGKEKIERMD